MLAPLLLAIGAVLTALALLAGWAQWHLLDTARWAGTSQELLQRDEVRQVLADYVVSEVRSSAGGLLPEGYDRELETTVERALATEPAERAWRSATTRAHRQLVRVIEDPGAAEGDLVVLDLEPVIRAVLRDADLPAVSVPADAARVTIVAGDQVRGAREAARRLERTATVLVILAPLTLLLAVAVARGWRAAALSGAGIAIAAGGAIVLLVRALVGSNVVDVLSTRAGNRDAVEAAWSTGTGDLATMAAITIAAGLAIALAAGAAARRGPRYL